MEQNQVVLDSWSYQNVYSNLQTQFIVPTYQPIMQSLVFQSDVFQIKFPSFISNVSQPSDKQTKFSSEQQNVGKRKAKMGQELQVSNNSAFEQVDKSKMIDIEDSEAVIKLKDQIKNLQRNENMEIEIKKRNIIKIKNRISAQQSRDRVKVYIKNLEQENQILRNDNVKLLTQVNFLQQQIQNMKLEIDRQKTQGNQ